MTNIDRICSGKRRCCNIPTALECLGRTCARVAGLDQSGARPGRVHCPGSTTRMEPEDHWGTLQSSTQSSMFRFHVVFARASRGTFEKQHLRPFFGRNPQILVLEVDAMAKPKR